MTRAWLALLPALGGACTGPRAASTPWVVQPEVAGACAPSAISNGSCFPLEHWQEVLVPPVVVGPGRIQIVTRLGLRGIARPHAPARDQYGFVIDEITRAGDQRLAAGICPGRHPMMSELVGLLRLSSGETGLVCLENGHRDGCVRIDRVCTPYVDEYGPPMWDCPPSESCNAGFLHFGVIDRASHTIAWRWRADFDFGLRASTLRIAAVGDRVAVIDQHFSPGDNGWRVMFVPDGTVPPLPDGLGLDDALTAVFMAGDGLKLIFKTARGDVMYRELTIGKGGASALLDLDQRGRVTPSQLAQPCLAEDRDGALTVSLPYPDEARDRDDAATPAPRTLTLRYPDAIAPHGPDVFSTSRASCAPRIAAADVEWARASFDAVGPIIVYTLGGGLERAPSLRVERRAR